jgi:hypothetical protein
LVKTISKIKEGENESDDKNLKIIELQKQLEERED